MIKQIPLVFKLSNTRVNSKTVFRHTCKFTLILPRSFHTFRCSIRYIFTPFPHGSISQIIDTITFVKPRTFYILGQINNFNLAIQFNHIRLQFSHKTCTISPAQPSLSVLFNQHGRIDIIPPATCSVGRHIITYQWLSYSIYKRTNRRISNSHANRFSCIFSSSLNCRIIIKFAIFFNNL